VQALPPEQRPQLLQAQTPGKTPAGRCGAVWCLQPPQARPPAQEPCITRLCESSAESKSVWELSPPCVQMVQPRQLAALPAWRAHAEPRAVTERRRGATALRQDYAAGTAALGDAWSNGPVDGQSN
jgi:hypothetical protein